MPPHAGIEHDIGRISMVERGSEAAMSANSPTNNQDGPIARSLAVQFAQNGLHLEMSSSPPLLGAYNDRSRDV